MIILPANHASNASHEQFAIVPLSALAALGDCTRAEILAFTALASHADAHGHCWPGRERLAHLTGLNPSRISKATTGLERRGLIRKECRNGIRVDYYLLTPGSRTRSTAPPLTETAHRTDHVIQKQKSATPPPAPSQPAPAAPPPPTATAALVEEKLRKTKTGAPDAIPEAWLEQAWVSRPDLTPLQIASSAEVFLNHHRAKGTELHEWIYAWRNWIKRERVAKPRPIKQVQPPQPTPLSAEERAAQDAVVAERIRLADEAAEQRRVRLLVAAGIDPTTGLPVGPVEAGAVEAVTLEVVPPGAAATLEIVPPVETEPVEAAPPEVVPPEVSPLADEPRLKTDKDVPVPPPRSNPPPKGERERQEQFEINRQRTLREWERRMRERGIPLPGD